MTTGAPMPDAGADVRHEALLYDTLDTFVAQVGVFLDDAHRVGDPVLVLVDQVKAEALRDHLGPLELVRYGDMASVGANPARVLPAWQAFVDEVARDHGRGSEPLGVRGVVEPAWPGRTRAELAECALHEALLNLVLAESARGHLLCPYDVANLDPHTVDDAVRHHPVLRTAEGVIVPSATYHGPEAAMAMFAEPLEPPPEGVGTVEFEGASLVGLRHYVHTEALGSGLSPDRADDITLAVDEIATNSVVHGGGRGVLRVWLDGRTFVCEVSDAGRLAHPLVGRHRPPPTHEGGRGLWMANHLCDLVQLRSPASGTVARLHMHIPSS